LVFLPCDFGRFPIGPDVVGGKELRREEVFAKFVLKGQELSDVRIADWTLDFRLVF